MLYHITLWATALTAATIQEDLDDASGLIQMTASFQVNSQGDDSKPQLVSKVQELTSRWDEHVRKRIPEINAEKIQKAAEKEAQAARQANLARSQQIEKDAEAARAAEEAARAKKEQEEAKRLASTTITEPTTVTSTSTTTTTTSLSPEQLEKQEKFGDTVSITVHTRLYTFDTKVRRLVRSQVLMESLCHKLQINCKTTGFYRGWKPLERKLSLAEAGIKDKDEIWLDGPDLEKMAAAQAASAKTALNSKAQVSDAPKEKVDTDRIRLRFVHQFATEKPQEVSIAVKRGIALKGIMQLVCGRLGIGGAQFRRKDGQTIKPGDSAAALFLKDMEEIIVHSPSKMPS